MYNLINFSVFFYVGCVRINSKISCSICTIRMKGYYEAVNVDPGRMAEGI